MGGDNNNNNNMPLVWGLPGSRLDRGPRIPLHIPPPPHPPVGRPTLMMGPYPHPNQSPSPNPNPNPNLQLMLRPPTMPPLQGVPVESQTLPKPNPFLLPRDNNANNNNNKKDAIEKGGVDDSVFTIRHRKVRISDRSSIYALCRSWLQNGVPEESQPQYGDALHTLPRPLPMPISSSPKRDEESELKEDQDENTVGTLDAEELLQGHIKRAKRVRARLREERLQRIERYSGRLDLLLRPQVEQFKNDASASLPAG